MTNKMHLISVIFVAISFLYQNKHLKSKKKKNLYKKVATLSYISTFYPLLFL